MFRFHPNFEDTVRKVSLLLVSLSLDDNVRTKAHNIS